MSFPPCELAIFGTTPLAGLLAGVLASTHRKRVVLIAETPSPFRLPTGIDLSVGPITRPETWALQKAGIAETMDVLGLMRASRAIRRLDPLFVAETVSGQAALSHMRMMAMGFGFAAEPAPSAAGQSGVRVRDAMLLDRAVLAPRLSTWLGRIGVERVEARHAKAAFSGDGSVRIDYLGQTIEAAHAVLADDDAILTRLGAAFGDAPLKLQQSVVTLTAPTPRLNAPLVFHLDRDLALVEVPGGQILIYGVEQSGDIRLRGGAHLDLAPLRRVARRQLRRVTTRDGAPLVGPGPGGNTTIIAGLGPGGMFFAPALARHLVGASSATEKAYFAARQAQERAAVADYAAPAPIEAAA